MYLWYRPQVSLLCCKVKGKEGNEKAGYNDKNNDLFLKYAGQASRLVELTRSFLHYFLSSKAWKYPSDIDIV